MNTPTKALPANDVLETVARYCGKKSSMYRYIAQDLEALAAQDAALSAPQAGGECTQRHRCDCLGACKYGRGGHGAAPPSAPAVLDRPARVAGRDFAAGQPEQQVIGRAQAHYDAQHQQPSAPADGEVEDVLRGLENWARLNSDETTREFLREAAALIRRLTRSAGPQGEVAKPTIRLVIIGKPGDMQAIRQWENIGELPPGEYFLYTHPATRELPIRHWLTIRAHIATLEGQLAEAQGELAAKDEAYRLQFEACARLGEVEARLAEVEADARRYRYLKAKYAFRNPEYGTAGVGYYGFYSSPLLKGKTLDAAIDAAMEAK
jgi:hypothetical protein